MPPSPKVAIVGGGVAGICCARACVEHSLDVTLFDRRLSCGGIWSLTAGETPVFDNLTLNTACFENALSDVPPPRVDPLPALSEHDDLCTTRAEFAHYITTVAQQTKGFDEFARFGVSVERVEAVASGGYYVHFESVATTMAGDGGTAQDRHEDGCQFFDFVIVASGNNNTPYMPTNSLPGLNDFPGDVFHASDYKSPQQVAGKRVLVVGGSISGEEVAGDIATAESPVNSVTVSSRVMRDLSCKQKDGGHFISELSSRFHRLRQLAGRLYENDGADMRALSARYYMNEKFGAPAADQPIFRPGAPNWCPINYKVFEGARLGRIQWNIGGVANVGADGVVEFNNGEQAAFDVIILATGYELSFPFLDEKTNAMIRWPKVPSHFLDLCDYTFHPDLPGLAFAGIMIVGSPATPMIDAQARWIARAFADAAYMPARDELQRGVEATREVRNSQQWHIVTFAYEVVDRFAERGGFTVDLRVHPEWTKALLLGPLVPAQFRLFGAGRRDDALEELERQMTAAGFRKGDNVVDAETLRRLQVLADELPELSEFEGLQEAVAYLVKVNAGTKGGDSEVESDGLR